MAFVRKSIPKAELKVGAYYAGHCRNASVARWNGTVFIYKRYKFGTFYHESINHPDDDDGMDLYYASRECEAPDEEIPLSLR